MCTFCNVKCVFIFFNGLLLVSGVGLIILGAQYSMYKHTLAFSWALDSLSIVLMSLGVMIVLLSFSGFYAACTNSFSTMACFICALIMVILLEILTGISFYVLSSRIDKMDTKAKELINDDEKNQFPTNATQEKGCLSAFKQYLYTNMLWVGAVCMVLGLAEVLGVIAGIVFFVDLKKEKLPEPQVN